MQDLEAERKAQEIIDSLIDRCFPDEEENNGKIRQRSRISKKSPKQRNEGKRESSGIKKQKIKLDFTYIAIEYDKWFEYLLIK